MKEAPFFSDIADGPDDGAAVWAHTKDDVRIRVGFWGLKTAENGTLIIFPGRSGYIERYGRIASSFSDHGFASLVVDWRGHGLADRLASDKRVGHIGSFLDYQLDVDAVFATARHLNLPEPWFLMGTSMGGAIGLRALNNGLSVQAAVFNAPMWGIQLSTLQRMAAVPITKFWNAMGKGSSYAPGCNGSIYVLTEHFEDNNLTHDEEMYAYWALQASEQPSLLIGGPSMGWLFEAMRESTRLSEFSCPNVKSLVIWGDEDDVMDQREIERRRGSWPDVQFQEFTGARHDVLSELPEIRNAATNRIVRFLLSSN